MNNTSLKSNTLLTKHQYMALIINSVLGVGILTLPELLAQKAHNSAWISVLLAGIPLIITIKCIYSAHKNYNFISIEKLLFNIFGKIPSKIILVFFVFVQLITILDIIVNMCSLLRSYVDYSIPLYVYIFFIILVSLYACTKGLNTIAKCAEILLYFITPIFFIVVLGLNKGSYLNVLPIINKGDIKNIFFSLRSSCTAFIGSELSLYYLHFAYHDEKSDYKKINRFIYSYLLLTYTLVTFSVLFVLTWYASEYTESSLIYILEMFKIPLINNFRSYFLVLWLLNAINCVTIHFFAVINIAYNALGQRFKSKKYAKKILTYICYCLLFLFSLILAYNYIYFKTIIPKIDTINYFLIFIISILCYFISKKKKESFYNEKNKQ